VTDVNDLTRYRLIAGLPVPAGAKLIYCYLLDVSDGSGVAISIRRLGKSVGLSRSATRKSLHRLKRMDMLDIAPRYSEDGGRLSNQYRLK
jgi:response regulator of citrate/malate metabolism